MLLRLQLQPQSKRIVKSLGIFILTLAICGLISCPAFCGVEYQGTTESSRKNALGGYDYYDQAGKRTGYSVPNRSGGYDYYDASGNKTGTLRKASKKDASYTFYDADRIRKGTLKRGATGTYSYRDVQRGTTTESASQLRKEIGSLSPETFQGQKRRR